MKYFSLIIIALLTSSLVAQDTLRIVEKKARKVRTYEKSKVINASPAEVFAFMDNIENTGMHMTKSNSAMMGSKLMIHWLSDHKTGLGTKYRWTGKVVGMKMDFTVEVKKWRR